MPDTSSDTLGLLAELSRPHYVLNPRQLGRRLVLAARPLGGEQLVGLPWGEEIICDADENIGRLLVRRGVFDLLVCEVLARLADPDELALDVGANIGQMTSLLARAVGPGGTVIAFEPHPAVARRLERNVAAWSAMNGNAAIEVHRVALSDSPGTATLSTDVFDNNQGSASLEPKLTEGSALDSHTVETGRLDEFLNDRAVGVMKIDIEGHEFRALQGARHALAAGRIRDIIFEAQEISASPVTGLLRDHGYSVLQVEEQFRGPAADQLGARRLDTRGENINLLATRDPERALARISPLGWAVLNVGRARRLRRLGTWTPLDPGRKPLSST